MAYLICLACLFRIPCLILLSLLDLLSLLSLSGLLNLLGVLTGFLPACSRVWLVVCLLACLVGWLFDWSVSWWLTCSLARSVACLLLGLPRLLILIGFAWLSFWWPTLVFNLHTLAWLLHGLLTGLLELLGFLDLRGMLALLDLLGLLASLCLPPSRFACALRFFLRYLLALHCLPFCWLTSFARLPKIAWLTWLTGYVWITYNLFAIRKLVAILINDIKLLLNMGGTSKFMSPLLTWFSGRAL